MHRFTSATPAGLTLTGSLAGLAPTTTASVRGKLTFTGTLERAD